VYGAQQRCHEFENGSKKDHNCHLSQCFALVELRKERRRGFPLIRAQFVRKTIKTEGFFSGSLERRIMKKIIIMNQSSSSRSSIDSFPRRQGELMTRPRFVKDFDRRHKCWFQMSVSNLSVSNHVRFKPCRFQTIAK
jgi:hypothetical protein